MKTPRYTVPLIAGFAASLFPASAQNYTWTTVVGNAGYGSADGTASQARFNHPHAVAVDQNGIVFVADYLNHTIRKITADGVVTTLAGLAGTRGSADGSGSTARFDSPTGVAVDRSGNVFVADQLNATLRKITADGIVSTLAGSAGLWGLVDGTGSAARFNFPDGVAVDANGNLAVSSVNRIRRVTSDGIVTTLAGGGFSVTNPDGIGTAASFSGAAGLAVDAAGSVYVADSFSNTIRKVTSAGVVTTLAGRHPIILDVTGIFNVRYSNNAGSADGPAGAAQFNYPRGVAVNAAGNVFVADCGNSTIRKITSGGTVTTLAGKPLARGTADGTGSDARFLEPEGVAADASGDVFVADSSACTIRKITAGGMVTTFAGIAPSNLAGVADSLGTTVRFGSPEGIEIDPSGNLYVADSDYAAIRKIAPDGVVKTFADIFGAAGGSMNTTGVESPCRLAVDGRGNVFFVQGRNHTVRKITVSGVVSTVAGWAGVSGSTDGNGSSARFNTPCGIAVDTTGTVVVADTQNHTVRKITSDGLVTTLAGAAGSIGTTDGARENARFHYPADVAVDRDGNVFVSDSGNHTIRRIAPDGNVTTFAGTGGSAGSSDGIGDAARFDRPGGLAIDGRGNLFVVEENSGTIRRIDANGMVTTIGGWAGARNWTTIADGPGAVARFLAPSDVAVDRGGNVYVTDRRNRVIRKGAPDVAPTMVVEPPLSQHVGAGASASFAVAATGSALRYQWNKDGSAIGGATGAMYTINHATFSDMGFYSVVVSGADGVITSPAAIFTVATGGTSRLVNISTRGVVPVGGDLTPGLVIRGHGAKRLVIRAVGPQLQSFGLANLADPSLELMTQGGLTPLLSNDDWGGGASLQAAFAEVGAFPLTIDSRSAAVATAVEVEGTRALTVRVASSSPGESGVVLAEIYDHDAATSVCRIINVSTRGYAGLGSSALVPGFVVGGTEPKRLLIRVVGPGLASFGVTEALADPQVAVVPLGRSFSVVSNDDWGGSSALSAAFAQAGAFALAPDSKDAALVTRLPPGGYTVTVTGTGNTTGTALVEIFDLDP